MEKKCVKCRYDSEKNHKKFNVFICDICYKFSPNTEQEFNDYINEKIDGEVLETFRKNYISPGEKQKEGMIKKAIKGESMSRAPLGYKIENKKLVLGDNFRDVERIFEDFLSSNESLTKISKRYGLSVNGLKKILTNFTYIGKIRFNNEIYNGTHQAIISHTLFNHVQNKLEKMGINKTKNYQ